VISQGTGLFRALPPDVKNSLRYYEVALLEEIDGDKISKLSNFQFYYFALSDDTLYIVERSGKAPRKVTILLEDIVDVVCISVTICIPLL
jgi:hypothetical protein